MDRSDIGSWLSGPQPESAGAYRGQRLGLPQSGPGSLAGPGRRLAALFIDWISCVLLTRLFLPSVGSPSSGLVTLLIFAAELFVFSWLLGGSFGQRIMGIRLLSVKGHPLPPLAIVVRTVLLCLAVPALIWDRDGRGLHDRWTNGMLIRSR